jgi:MFS family permease
MTRLLPALPRIAWAYLATRVAPAFGNGLALPFVLIYLHDVRGIALGTAGLVWGGRILLVVVGSFAAGPLIDRYGPVPVSLVGLVLTAVGWGSLGFAASLDTVIASSVVAAIGGGLNMPTSSLIVGAVAAPRIRHRVFALEFGIFNLGIAVGAAVAGLIARSSQPHTYTLLFLVTGLMYLPTFAFNAYVGLARRAPAAGAGAHGAPLRGYLGLLRDPLVARLVAASVAYFLAGEAIWTVGIGPYMKSAGFGEARIGLLFTANTVAVFCFQLLAARLVEGRARLRVLAAGQLAWGAVFVVLVVVARLLDGTALYVGLVVLAVAVAAAECAAPPIVQPLLLDVAPEGLQGRAMALLGKGQTIGMAAGTAIVGVLLDVDPDVLWIGAAVVLAASGVLLLTTPVAPELRDVPVSSAD